LKPSLLIKEVEEALKEDGVYGTVLGCTGMINLTEKLDEGLKDVGY